MQLLLFWLPLWAIYGCEKKSKTSTGWIVYSPVFGWH